MSSVSDRFVHVLTRVNIALYRSTGGRIGGRVGKAPILLLTTTGRRSGAARTTPLLFLRDDERIVVVASYGGRPSHPAWYLNLLATPQAGGAGEARPLRRRRAHGRARGAAGLWPKLVEMYPSYAQYEKRTTREIPVVVLERTSLSSRRTAIRRGRFPFARRSLHGAAPRPVHRPGIRMRFLAAQEPTPSLAFRPDPGFNGRPARRSCSWAA